MANKIPWILNDEFNMCYYEVSNRQEVEQYNEIDLGELNFITHHIRLDDEKEKVYKETLRKKTYGYHRDRKLLLPVIPVLEKLKIGNYTTDEQVIEDYEHIYMQLYKRAYFLNGTKTACLLKTETPTIDHHDFKYFFAAKLHLVSKNLFRIDQFLDFQHQKFMANNNSNFEFKQFLKLALRQYGEDFNFSEQAMETINERLATTKDTSLDGIANQTQNADIKWTASKVDLIQFIYAAFKLGKINDGKGEIGDITFEILQFFGHTYKKGGNSLSNSVNQKIKRGGHPEEFFDELKKAFLEYLDDPHCFKR